MATVGRSIGALPPGISGHKLSKKGAKSQRRFDRGRGSGSLDAAAPSVTDVPDATLQLLVNGKPREIPAGSTVRGLVEALDLDQRRIAVAVNRDVVPRSRYGRQALAAGDRVEILEAIGGG